MTLWERILALPVITHVVDLSKTYALPGMGKVPIYNVVMFIYGELQRETITTRANAVAFSFFLSLFPSLIFLFTLIPLLPVSANYLELIDVYLKDFLPVHAHLYLMEIITDIASIKREGLLSLGFFLAVFFASSGMLTLMSGFDKSHTAAFKKRSWVRERVIAVLLTGLLAFLLISSFVMVVLGSQLFQVLLGYLEMSEHSVFLVKVLRWVILLLLFYTVFTTIYTYGPSMHKRLHFFNPGATLATILSLLSSGAFAYFVNNFGQYNELYGSIGALIVLLIWIQINAFILIAGFELNASIAVNRFWRVISNKNKFISRRHKT